jgi:hypothetical protein
MLRQGRELRASQNQQGKQYSLRKRFWKDVDVKETAGSSLHASLRQANEPDSSHST